MLRVSPFSTGETPVPLDVVRLNACSWMERVSRCHHHWGSCYGRLCGLGVFLWRCVLQGKSESPSADTRFQT